MRIRTFLNVLAAGTLAGCIPTGACTLIGCFDGLAVEFSRAPAGPFRIEAIVPNDATPRAIDCADAATCETMFRDLMAEEVTIRLTTAQGTISQSFRPRYANLYPNGRQCGPTCRQATVTVQVPG